MQLKQFIGRLNNINSQHARVEYGTDIEKEEVVARALLRKVIQTLKTRDQNQDVSPEDIDLLSKLLSDRWDRIKDTDASYFVNPNSWINQAYIEIAKQLSLLTKRYWLAHLLPTLDPKQMLAFDQTKLDFKRYVMNDNFTLMIPLSTLIQANTLKNNPDLVPLYQASKRVAAHSNKHGKKANQDTEANQEIIGISYGPLGEARLKDRVTQLSDYLYADKSDLFRAMSAQDRSSWANLMAGLSKDKLTALLLNDGKLTLAQAIEQLQVLSDDVKAHAMLFAYTTLFIEHRKEGWEYGNPLLAAPGVVGMVYGKTVKLEAAEALRTFLVNKDNSLAQFHLYFEKLDERLKGPMKNGVLSQLRQQFISIPGLHHPQVTVMHL